MEIMFPVIKCIARAAGSKFNFQPVAKCSSKFIQNAVSHQASSQTVGQTFGQPTYYTHPHLLKEGEVLPGLKTDEFKNRRNKLMGKISTVATEEHLAVNPQILIIPAASKAYMSDKIPYVFRQNTDFLYLTGCQEPDSIFLMVLKGDTYSSTLFIRPKDAHAELWDGPRSDPDTAAIFFSVEQVLPITDFERYLMSLLNENKKSTVWYDNEDVIHPETHKKIFQTVRLTDKEFKCPKKLIHEVRVIKSEAEVNLMRKSCEIASAAISKTIEKSKPGMSEQDLFATVDYECRMKGAEFLAYPPVVAGGKNANIIHYISNNQIVRSKEMVLMDAGCEYHGYTSDITRTWPIDGTFTKEQRILYEIVLDVQKTLINKLCEMPSLDMLYHDMCALLGERLQEECLIPKYLSGNKLISAAYSFCPHHVSHYLGMDVHDTSKISRSIRVQPGMIVTVEPGVYVNPKNQFAPPEFHNIGIRIEDDILVQANALENLCKSCPKEVMDIENLSRKNQT